MPISPQDMSGISGTSNIVSIWSRLSVDHKEYLSNWLKAGRAMGLLDVEAVNFGDAVASRVHVLVWVRECPDAAYRVHPNGAGWTVSDNLRSNELSRHPTFERALEAIRPVYSYAVAAPRRRAGRAQRGKAPVASGS